MDLTNIVQRVSNAGRDEPGHRLESLEPEHLAAYAAFRRPARPVDRALGAELPTASFLAPPLNPDLGRRVYDGVEGTIDLVPGPDMICCVACAAETGEQMSSRTSTALAIGSPHGFIEGAADGTTTFIGVLPAGARELQITDGSGEAITVSVNNEDAYWVTFEDAVDMSITRRSGTVLRVPFPGSNRC